MVVRRVSENKTGFYGFGTEPNLTFCMLLIHMVKCKYCCIFKTATLVYKLLHSGSPSYFKPFLSFSSCPCTTRHSHPDRQYLTVPPFHSSVF